jgi:hypothetical protein
VVSITADEPGVASPQPYATAVAAANGTFTTSFRLEKKPSGAALTVGRLDLVVSSSATTVRVQFQVSTARPVPPTPSGG